MENNETRNHKACHREWVYCSVSLANVHCRCTPYTLYVPTMVRCTQIKYFFRAIEATISYKSWILAKCESIFFLRIVIHGPFTWSVRMFWSTHKLTNSPQRTSFDYLHKLWITFSKCYSKLSPFWNFCNYKQWFVECEWMPFFDLLYLHLLSSCLRTSTAEKKNIFLGFIYFEWAKFLLINRFVKMRPEDTKRKSNLSMLVAPFLLMFIHLND